MARGCQLCEYRPRVTTTPGTGVRYGRKQRSVRAFDQQCLVCRGEDTPVALVMVPRPALPGVVVHVEETEIETGEAA